MASRKKRKRDRLRAGGDRDTPPPAGSGGGSALAPVRADWLQDVRESCALVRRAIREDWPTELGPEILAALWAGDGPTRPADVVRVCRLLLGIDGVNARREV